MNRLVVLVLALAAAVGCASVPQPAWERPLTLGPPEPRALAIVRIPMPWWAPKWLVARKFVDSLPEYAYLPGLEQKAYLLTEDGRYGGAYLWESRAAAEAWFDEAWHQRVKKTRGVDGDVRLFDARWTVWGEEATGQTLPESGLRTDAVVTWFSSAVPLPREEAESRLKALAAVHGLAAGLVRVSFVMGDDGKVGVVSLWRSRAAAEGFWTPSRRSRVAQAIGAEVESTWFSAPVLLDAAQAKRDQAARQRPAAVRAP